MLIIRKLTMAYGGRTLFEEAKKCGEEANAARNEINKYKNLIERLRTARAMQSNNDDEPIADPNDPEEAAL